MNYKRFLIFVLFALSVSVNAITKEIVMNDTTSSIALLKQLMKKFVDDRQWNQFHTPKNLSTKIAIEAAELMELFTWCEGPESHEILTKQRQDVEDELADIFMTIIAFANACNIDLSRAFEHKLAIIAQRYPVEQCKGKSDKYTAYTGNNEEKNK